MTKPRVSAVITAYNSEAYVAEALSSVLEQSCPVDEIIVVDDGSTDRTRDIVAPFSQRGVRYLYQENLGPGAARNSGIRGTSGELVAFLDADDVWLKEKIKIQRDFLLEHPEVALVSGFAWWWNVIRDRRFLSGEVPKGIASLRRDLLVYNKIGNPSRVMLRRSVLEQVGVFDQKIRWGQDWDLWIRIITRYDAAILPEPVILYRWHEKNLSHTRGWERLSSYWNISRQAIRANRPPWQRPLLMLRSWSLFTYRRARYLLLQERSRWRSIAYALAAFLAYPMDMGWEKFNIGVQALLGDNLYHMGKRIIRSRLRGGGGD
jgi:glycosyltransferase involved in cell wall biosynthesis